MRVTQTQGILAKKVFKKVSVLKSWKANNVPLLGGKNFLIKKRVRAKNTFVQETLRNSTLHFARHSIRLHKAATMHTRALIAHTTDSLIHSFIFKY